MDWRSDEAAIPRKHQSQLQEGNNDVHFAQRARRNSFASASTNGRISCGACGAGGHSFIPVSAPTHAEERAVATPAPSTPTVPCASEELGHFAFGHLEFDWKSFGRSSGFELLAARSVLLMTWSTIRFSRRRARRISRRLSLRRRHFASSIRRSRFLPTNVTGPTEGGDGCDRAGGPCRELLPVNVTDPTEGSSKNSS